MNKEMNLKIFKQRGFTLIELLIVIAVLGILAVAVLSAINPIEQINRSRDTGTVSDAEQLLSGMDRYNAARGYFPWKSDDTDTTTFATMTTITAAAPAVTGAANCSMLEALSNGQTGAGGCTGAEELKPTFTTRVTSGTFITRPLLIYYAGSAGSSPYVCFMPRSGDFLKKANDRCVAGLPADLAIGQVCNLGGGTVDYYCLP